MHAPQEFYAELEKDNKRLRAMVQLSLTLADPGHDLGDKLQVCVEELARLARAERASLMLAEGGSLVVRAATDQGLLGLATPLDQRSISTQAVAGGEPVYLQRIQESDFAQVGRQGDKSTYRTGSLISLPLLEDGEVVGVLNLSDKAGAAHFDAQDVEMARGIASQVTRLINFSALHSRLQNAYQELQEAQRSKDELMHLVFHDMKAPVTGVKEMLKLLRPEGGLEPAEREQFLALADSDLEMLWRRITNLLDLKRMDGGQMPVNLVPLDLAALAREAAGRLKAAALVRGVELGLKAEAHPEVRADEDLVERIVANLLINALKFSSPEEGGGGWVRLAIRQDHAWALVEVTDSGPGVDPALGESVFERFAQGRAAPGSTGLGLYFCRRAASQLGGEVAYQNLDAGGACFSLRLPL